MKVINKRVMMNTDAGFACSPFGVTACDSEVAIEDDGKIIYIHGQWCDAADDDIRIELTDESIYDYELKLNNAKGDELDELIAARDAIADKDISEWLGADAEDRYAEYIFAAQQMVLARLAEEGIELEEEG